MNTGKVFLLFHIRYLFYNEDKLLKTKTMKKLFLPFLMFMSIAAIAQNPLLQNATTGSIPNTGLNDLCMVSNGTDVVLVAADNNAVYAIDIADKNAANATANTVTTIPNFVSSKLTSLAGQTVTVLDMAVNPISKTVYVLGSGGTNRYIFKVEKNGATVTLLNISNISHSKLAWGGTGFAINDMAFGNNMLYVSSGSFSLDGELGWMAPPFVNNSSFTRRSTTLFKSNWGGQYFTSAPLETLTFGNVAGKNRLMGVTTCAPGFSIDVSTLQGAGLLSVTEDFDVHFGEAMKAVFMHHDKSDWLFNLHDDKKIYRIGKKYIDGSQVSVNKHNNAADMLRDNAGNVVSTLPATDIKVVSTKQYSMMAFWDDYRLLLLESGTTGALTLSQMSIEKPPVPVTGIQNIDKGNGIALYPNPASNQLTLTLPEGHATATVNIVSISGSVVLTQNISNNTTTLNIQGIPAGMYSVSAQLANGEITSGKITIE
jgi:hypothetical protein